MTICPRKVLPMDDLSAAALAQLAYDRTEIAETFSRYAAGLDENDPELLGMALAQDCVLDFSAGGEKLGLDFPVLHGRAAVVEALIAIIGPLDTSHTASNLRIEVNGERATMKAFLMAQHYMPGDGPRRGTEHALLMNRYDTELVRDGRHWRFTRLTIDNAWAEGDPGIITAMATHRAARSRQNRRC
jgi:hypothetical protein